MINMLNTGHICLGAGMIEETIQWFTPDDKLPYEEGAAVLMQIGSIIGAGTYRNGEFYSADGIINLGLASFNSVIAWCYTPKGIKND